MIELEKHDEARPLCPHCASELRKVLFQRLKSPLGKRYVYFCPTCRKVLGISHRKEPRELRELPVRGSPEGAELREVG